MNYTLVFVAAIIVLVILYFGQIYLSQFKLIGKTNPLLGDRVGESDSWQIYYFFSPECDACKNITPVVRQHQQIIAFDISSDLETARKFNIKTIPTTVFVENNKVVNVELGSGSLQLIADFINKHEPS
ncbi:hypothetical protein A9Q85_04405 [Cycloclasticus sp. 44_32_T64]|nr:hypothetical protein A9Q85_04405 [Cycloclasticus sp. 44_32_T64]